MYKWMFGRQRTSKLLTCGNLEDSITSTIPKERMHYRAAVEILERDNVADRCIALEYTFLPLTFHHDAAVLLLNDENVFKHVFNKYCSQLEEATNNSFFARDKETRLSGWILGNIAFTEVGRKTLPAKQYGDKVFFTFLLEYVVLVSNNESMIPQLFDEGSPVLSVLDSVILILINFSTAGLYIEIYFFIHCINLFTDINKKYFTEQLLDSLQLILNSKTCPEKLKSGISKILKNYTL